MSSEDDYLSFDEKMSQEIDYEYELAINAFEFLEKLFHDEHINYNSVINVLNECYLRVEDIMSRECLNSVYLLRQHISKLFEIIQSKIDLKTIKIEHKTVVTNVKQPVKKPVVTETDTLKKIVKATLEIPSVGGLLDIAGLWEAKKSLKSIVILPKTQPQLFKNRKPCNSILLFGPPGTGKTKLVHALAAESNALLYSVSVGNILSSYVGQSEKTLQMFFKYIQEDKNYSILFFDEVDSISRKRNEFEQEHNRRFKTEFMCQMTKAETYENLIVICVTNCPWDLDTAILRRFQKRIFISLPDKLERLELLRLFTKDLNLDQNSEYWTTILDRTHGYSGSDLHSLVQNALNIPLNELEDTMLWKECPDGFYEPLFDDKDFPNTVVCGRLEEMPPNSVRARNVNIFDLVKSLDSVSLTVHIHDLNKYTLFNTNVF